MCGGVAVKQRSSYSAIIHLARRQAATASAPALLTLSLRAAGYDSRYTTVDTGPHSRIPPWERRRRRREGGREEERRRGRRVKREGKNDE